MKPFTALYKTDDEPLIVRVMAVDAALEYAVCLNLDAKEGELADVLVLPIRSLATYSDVVDDETGNPQPK
jgi:hypothetical protein